MTEQELSNKIKELNNLKFRTELLPIVNKMCNNQQARGELIVDDIIRYVLDAMAVELAPPSINNQESE